MPTPPRGCSAADSRPTFYRRLQPWRARLGRLDRNAAGSVSGVTAVDVEDMAGDERSFVRRNEDDRVGKLLRETEATHRNTRHQSRLVLRRARKTGQHVSVRRAR